MARALLLFVIGLVLGTGIGFLASGNLALTGHDHAGHADDTHDHSTLTPWTGDPTALSLAIEVLPDGPTSRNLRIITNGFAWTPDQTGGPVTAGGHAHVYVNGEKVARAYGEWLHLDNFPAEGPTTVYVTFNANDHSVWSLDGQPIALEAVVE